MARKSKQEWKEIEAAYVSGCFSLRNIADAHGVTEGAIRQQAKKQGWIKDATAEKRALVRRAMSGASAAENAREIVESEAQKDVDDMNRGIAIARNCLIKLEALSSLPVVQDWMADAEPALLEKLKSSLPKDLKAMIDAAAAAVNTIRKIRGLDEEDKDTGAMSLNDLKEEIARLSNEVSL
jgi:hypothetical protein